MSLIENNPREEKILILHNYSKHIHEPYIELAKKHRLSVDFFPLTSKSPVAISDFRQYKRDILTKRNVILFTSKANIDYFFQLAQATKIVISDDQLYFCSIEPLKHYLKKHLNVVRYRKIISGNTNIKDIFPKIKKIYSTKKFLFPSSNIKQQSIIDFFKQNKISYKELLTHKTTINTIPKETINDYKLVLFFSPYEIQTFSRQIPKFSTSNTKIALFGKSTKIAAEKKGWEAVVSGYHPKNSSLVDLLDPYLKNQLPK